MRCLLCSPDGSSKRAVRILAAWHMHFELRRNGIILGLIPGRHLLVLPGKETLAMSRVFLVDR